MSIKLKENESLEKHYLQFEETVRELKTVGAKLQESDIVCHLLRTLPKSYDGIVTALQTLDNSKLTLEFVKGKLLDQELKRNNLQEEASEDVPAPFKSTVYKQYHGQVLIHKEILTKVFPLRVMTVGNQGIKDMNVGFGSKLIE